MIYGYGIRNTVPPDKGCGLGVGVVFLVNFLPHRYGLFFFWTSFDIFHLRIGVFKAQRQLRKEKDGEGGRGIYQSSHAMMGCFVWFLFVFFFYPPEV